MSQAWAIASILATLVASPSWAGGWSSSGGELFRDSKNPWFVRSASEVRYCVQVSEVSVSASPARVQELVRSAIAYWKKEFAKVSLGASRGRFAVATQSFVEVPCTEYASVDLRFLVGYETLNAEEIKFLEDPTRYIGVSVRQDYATDILRGKGFIFISSDRGPHAYQNPHGSLISESWKHETLLFYALLHELGHVFGLPHAGSGLMAEVFLDQMLNKAIHWIFLKHPIESFFFPDDGLENCQLSGQSKAWFGLTPDFECVLISPKQGVSELPVLARKAGGMWETAGHLRNIRSNLLQDNRERPAVILALVPGQKVFSDTEAAFRSFMVGASFVDYGAEAVYFPVNDPLPRSAQLRFTSGSFQVLGEASKKLFLAFNHVSLIGTQLFLVP